MCMREEQIVNIFGVESQFAVGGIGLHTFALIHATIKQNGFARSGRDEVFAACHLASSAKKLYQHMFRCYVIDKFAAIIVPKIRQKVIYV